MPKKAKRWNTIEFLTSKLDSDRATVINAASNGLGQNINSANESTPIPNFSTPPKQSGRFLLVNPFAGSNMASLAAANGVSLKVATCDGAVWVAQAIREIQDSSTLKLTSCLWQYENGYHLDVYASFNKKTGGIMQISRSMSDAMVGTSEEWDGENIFRYCQRNKKRDLCKNHLFRRLPQNAWYAMVRF